jgi:hypothetical protein
MIDQDLSNHLHSLAATMDEPFDLVALHRRITVQSRRRTAVKVGVAGAGVAAVVGGLFVLRDGRLSPADGLTAGTPAVTLAAQVQPPALPDCAVVLAGLRDANTTKDTTVKKDVTTEPSKSLSGVSSVGFKGIVTILTIDGQRVTFRNDEPKTQPPTSGDAVLDASTTYVDGPTPLDAPPTLTVGEQLALATTRDSDGVDHVIFVDTAASTTANALPDSTAVVPGPVLPAGPTEKAMGSIVSVDASSVTVTLTDQSGKLQTLTIDPATTSFYADATVCAPGVLTVGTQVGVAFHLDDAGNAIADDALLVP